MRPSRFWLGCIAWVFVVAWFWTPDPGIWIGVTGILAGGWAREWVQRRAWKEAAEAWETACLTWKDLAGDWQEIALKEQAMRQRWQDFTHMWQSVALRDMRPETLTGTPQ